MKIAFMFPGQGSQFEKMGKDIYKEYGQARNIFDKASKILEIDVTKLCFESNMEELVKTENAQIAIAVNSLAILEVLKANKIQAQLAVGLSLGEYVALIYGGYMTLEEGLKLLKKRSYYMANFLPKEEYKMAAVIGLESDVIEQVCKKLQKNGKFVVPANYNYSMQTVISGNADAIKIASKMLKENGAKRIIELNTSGPFHTSKLQEASDLFKLEFKKNNLKNRNIDSMKKTVKVIKNLDGTYYNENDNLEDILSRHIINPVRFDKALKLIDKENIDVCIEVRTRKNNERIFKKGIV